GHASLPAGRTALPFGHGRGGLGLWRWLLWFPGTRLDYAKIEEGLPFMTWEKAERRIAAGDDPERIWECLYLRPAEITEMLEWVKARLVSPWVYPMFVFAAHTGARRSEIVRARASDVDLANAVMPIREKKRDK